VRVLISIQQHVPHWQIPPESVARLRAHFPHIEFIYAQSDQERTNGLAECDVAYTWILNAREFDGAPRLRWVHSSAVAVETLCLPELFARGVLVSNTRGVQAVPIAEHVLAVALALAKQLPFVLENQRTARWSQNEFIGHRLPWLLQGRTLGLIGVGTIGSSIAARARAFGMRVVAMRRRIGHSNLEGLDAVYGPDQLPALLRQSDVLVIAAPLTPETMSLIGANELSQMPKGGIVVNVGRARILDTAALIDALRSGHLGGAALDVYAPEPLPADHPLWSAPNVILTPHTSGFRQGHWDEVVALFAENLSRFERGDELRFRVLPELGY
jgi:phosphoglycerate dehydrogenase-like enzyme